MSCVILQDLRTNPVTRQRLDRLGPPLGLAVISDMMEFTSDPPTREKEKNTVKLEGMVIMGLFYMYLNTS